MASLRKLLSDLRPELDVDPGEGLEGLHSEDQGVAGGPGAGGGAHHPGRLWDSFREHLIGPDIYHPALSLA